MLKNALLTSVLVVIAVTGYLSGSNASPDGVFDAGNRKQLFIDDMLIQRMHRLELVVNRPTLTGDKCIVADKLWEAAEVHPFGVTVLQDDDVIRMYYPSFDASDHLWFCYAESKDGITWRKPELDIVPFDDVQKTNILGPTDDVPESLRGLFFVTCVFKDTNPECPPDQRYKLINGDLPTWVFASPDGLHFKPMFDKPSFRAADTNNVAFFDDRIGRYVAYMRGFSRLPGYDVLRAVVRCEFDDLSDFGKETLVFAPDVQDQDSLDKTRFKEMDFYNSSAIKYPYAANAYFMFPSAFHRFPENTFDGIVDIQFATSRDGIKWTRLDRDPFIPLQEGQNGLYMASGIVRAGDKLYLYYGVYHQTHAGGPDHRNYVSRAELRLDGFVSVDAGDRQGRLFTIPLAFSGKHLKLNVKGEKVRVGLMDEDDQPIPGFALHDCDPISGDYIAKTVTWGGKSDLSALAGRTVKLVFSLENAKLYAFQFTQ